MSTRSVYESTCATSNTTLVNSNAANTLTAQESINGVGVNIGAETIFLAKQVLRAAGDSAP